MSMKPWQTHSREETLELGSDLASLLEALRHPRALVVGLEGNLGGGKTTFIQGMFSGLGIRQPAVSPTFTIIRPYHRRAGSLRHVYHIDCYRLEDPRELTALGFPELLADPQNLILIEWADMVKPLLPSDTLWLLFRHGATENERSISFRL